MDRTGAATLTLLFALSAAAPAHAFTTRVHIVVSNEIRAELVRSGDGTIQLRWSGHAVRIPEEDAEAIINQPLAFRAGAIGPDNVVFPAMTDGTHGVEQDPYGQCELLYREALTETERAYALGCFLHGATDAIAHHVVNYFTGETFTLNPISHGRTSDFDNVIGHIVSESAIQSALHASDPTLFSAGQLQHALPHDFLLRTYFNVESPVWQRMSLHARERWDAARATNPNGNVLTWAQNAGFAPWEQLAMAPVYVAELQRLRAELRLWIENEIADMADPSSARGRTLGVTPGPDGTYGTPDDATACTATCPSLAAQYYVYVNVLAPRYDAAGRELPSAFDVLSNAIGDQLYGFLPALVHVIENLSALLNAPIAPGDTDDHGLDVSAADLAAAFGPLSDWLDALVRTTDSGFDDLADAITPEWYRDLAAFLQSLGIDIRIGNVLRTIFGPIVENVRDTLEHEVRGRAEQFITDLTREYEERLDDWRASIEADLAISAPPGLGGHALDYPADAGVFAYAFNLAAVALAQHEVLLVAEDPIANGPASFDASYTTEWTQVGLCDYLREAVFPRGLGVAPLLSVQQGGTYFASGLEGDAPIECHAGSLEAFGTPSPASCTHTTLDALLVSRTGSLSRAFPPEFAAGDPSCRRLTVPGLPEPPPLPPDAGAGTTDGGVPGADGGASVDGGTAPAPAGCGCAVPARSSSSPFALASIGLFAWMLARSRRRASRRSARRRGRGRFVTALLAVLAIACDGAPAAPDAGSSERDAGRDGGETMMDASTTDPDAGHGDAGTDAGELDAGPDMRRQLLDALDGTVWSGILARDEGGRLVSRAYEMRFDSRDLRWAEIRNPYGPARQRILRSFNPRADGRTVESTIMIPMGWETPEPLRGRRETWEIEIVEGSPRVLVLRNVTTGIEEELREGPWPAPTGGLTAEVRVFGSSGPTYDAYCGAGFGTWERQPLYDFARGTSLEAPLRRDVVAGARIREWSDGIGTFAVTDIDGFDQLGGTLLSDQGNFIVRYTGSVRHSGHLSIREQDDAYTRMAAWVFTGAAAGRGGIGEHDWEIFHFIGNDDEVVSVPGLLGSGDLEVEVIVVWCTGAGAEPFTLQASLVSASGPWRLFGDLPSTPVVNETLFPPAL